MLERRQRQDEINGCTCSLRARSFHRVGTYRLFFHDLILVTGGVTGSFRTAHGTILLAPAHSLLELLKLAKKHVGFCTGTRATLYDRALTPPEVAAVTHGSLRADISVHPFKFLHGIFCPLFYLIRKLLQPSLAPFQPVRPFILPRCTNPQFAAGAVQIRVVPGAVFRATATEEDRFIKFYFELPRIHPTLFHIKHRIVLFCAW